jgi:hypothetical protein
MFLFESSSNIFFSTGYEIVTSFSEDSTEIISELSTGKIISLDTVRERVTLEDWNGVRNTITTIDNTTSSSTGGVERKNSLDRNIELWNLEVFKENLAHLFSVFKWVSWGFSKHSTVVFWLDSEFIEITMMPDFLHIIPIGNNTIFNRIMKFTDTSFGNSIFSNKFFFFLVWTNLFIFWYSDNSWES